jgi:hypothetical protein
VRSHDEGGILSLGSEVANREMGKLELGGPSIHVVTSWTVKDNPPRRHAGQIVESGLLAACIRIADAFARR